QNAFAMAPYRAPLIEGIAGPVAGVQKILPARIQAIDGFEAHETRPRAVGEVEQIAIGCGGFRARQNGVPRHRLDARRPALARRSLPAPELLMSRQRRTNHANGQVVLFAIVMQKQRLSAADGERAIDENVGCRILGSQQWETSPTRRAPAEAAFHLGFRRSRGAARVSSLQARYRHPSGMLTGHRKRASARLQIAFLDLKQAERRGRLLLREENYHIE